MFVVIMGVCGSGKTTAGQELAGRLGWPFYDADAFHPRANIEKMASGIPLTDADREPWLLEINRHVATASARGENGILACSALKEVYRTAIVGNAEASIIYLRGERGMLLERLKERTGHYMGHGMLDSQLDTLEEPTDALVIDAAEPPSTIVTKIVEHLALDTPPLK